MKDEPASRAETHANRTSPRSRAVATSGRRGEDLAAAYLRARGYRILAQNLRTVHGEIDLLARQGRSVIAVEVKARADHPAPERTVGDEQLQRLGRALRALADDHRPPADVLRIDVIAVRWCDPAAPELSHFPSVCSWQRRAGAPSSDSDWRPIAATEYSFPPDEVVWRRWCRRLHAAGRAAATPILRALRRWREG